MDSMTFILDLFWVLFSGRSWIYPVARIFLSLSWCFFNFHCIFQPTFDRRRFSIYRYFIYKLRNVFNLLCILSNDIEHSVARRQLHVPVFFLVWQGILFECRSGRERRVRGWNGYQTLTDKTLIKVQARDSTSIIIFWGPI